MLLVLAFILSRTCAQVQPILSTEAFEALTPQQRAEHCEATYPDLLEGVSKDLARWHATGITMQVRVKVDQVCR